MLEATPHRCRPDSPFAATCFHSVAEVEARAPQYAAGWVELSAGGAA